jgi:hypothetical protein
MKKNKMKKINEENLNEVYKIRFSVENLALAEFMWN